MYLKISPIVMPSLKYGPLVAIQISLLCFVWINSGKDSFRSIIIVNRRQADVRVLYEGSSSDLLLELP